MVTFTGSTAVGKKILCYSGESNLKRVTLELGGKAPQVVFESVLQEEGFLEKVLNCLSFSFFCVNHVFFSQVASHCTNAAFWNMSENCSCGARLVVHEAVKDRLLALILKELDARWIVG